jgi:hypothetical protein
MTTRWVLLLHAVNGYRCAAFLVLELSDGLVGRSNWDGVMFQRQLNNSSMEDTK